MEMGRALFGIAERASPVKETYVKPTIAPTDGNFVFEAMQKQVEEYKRTGMINGREVPVKSNISCRQCSACHGCR